MLIVILFSTPLAALVMPDNGGASVETMRIVLILISFALFFVPILSSLRGFYQGLKHMEIYSLSQVLEQLVRVGFLLSFSAFAVYVLNHGPHMGRLLRRHLHQRIGDHRHPAHEVL